MIRKLLLDKRNSFGTLDWLEKWNEPSGAKLIEQKINEIIEAINPILEERASAIKVYEEVMPNMQPADHYGAKYGTGGRRYIYERQSKWIGKLCRFRDGENDEWSYSVLKSIGAGSLVPFFKDAEDCEWAVCEPVSPTDNIIYKKD